MPLSPGATPLSALHAIWRGDTAFIDPAARAGVEAAAAAVHAAVEKGAPVYGVNTGFGKLANVRIPAEDTAALQRNLILSHCCGTGPETDAETVRLMMVLKLLSLARGASGVRWAVIELLEAMLAHGVLPVIPSQGSVGASGDLAPLAHLTAVMIGEGEARIGDNRLPGGDALAAAGLKPLVLGPKEGLAMINGTQFSTASALTALFRLLPLFHSSLIASALSTDALMGSTQPLTPEIHSLRGHQGQIDCADTLRALLDGSQIRDSHLEDDTRVQDPYCLRCEPQVAGAALTLIRQAGDILTIEANAVTDNPLILKDSGQIISGGNFHAEPVAFAADMLALAIAETGAIAQRRIAVLVDPALNHGLPPFLTPTPGLNSGFMIAEVTSAALMSENRHLANPCSTDSTPTSANQEDHVSMAAHGAQRLLRMTDNLACIIGIELLSAAQGVELRAPLATSPALARVIAALRKMVPPLSEDRILAGDIDAAASLVSGTAPADTAEISLPGLFS